MERRETGWSDSGWIGADADDDLDHRLAAEVEPFDLRQPHIMTALGPISPESLGPTLVGDAFLGLGLANDLDAHNLPGTASLTIADHLRAFADAGGGAIVAATTAGGGRDSRSLGWLAAWTPVHLIVATGGGADGVASMNIMTSAKAELMIEELTVGIDGTPLRAGTMLIELQNPTLSRDDTDWLTAADDVGAMVGVSMTLAVDYQATALAALAYLTDRGLDRSRVSVACRFDDNGGGATEAIMAAGASLVIDALVDEPEARRRQVSSIVDLVTRGYGDQVVLGAGPIGRSSTEGHDRPSWVTVLEWLPIQLMEAGLKAMTVRKLLVENPTRMLTIERGER